MTQHNRDLSLNQQGQDVVLLHNHLIALGFTIATTELLNELFGPTTRQAVMRFQQMERLAPTGVVDAATARAIADRFHARGGQPPAPQRPGLPSQPPRTPIEEEQTLLMPFPPLQGRPESGVPTPEQPIAAPPDRGTPTPGGPAQPPAGTAAPGQGGPTPQPPVETGGEGERRVYGMVRDEFGTPLNGVFVLAFARGMRSEQLLNRAVTKEGRYEIRYSLAQLRGPEKDAADLVLRVLGADEKVLYTTPVYYEAPAEIEINIGLQGAEYKGPSEFEKLNAALLPLLEEVPPSALREDSEFQDVSFLAGETDQSRLVIATWSACYRLAEKTAREKTPLEAAVFFGFLRQGQPSLLATTLLQDLGDPEKLAVLEDNALRDLTNLSQDYQQALLTRAIADNLIPARIQPQIPAILNTLQAIHLRYAAGQSYGGGKGTIGELLALNPNAQRHQAAFLTALEEYRGPMNQFWDQLVKQNILDATAAQQTRLTFEVGALTRNHIPLVAEVINMFERKEITAKRDLAKYSRADWISVLRRNGPDGKPIGAPANTDGATDEARLEQYAATLQQTFERSYPTTAFAANLGRAEQTPIAQKNSVVTFLDNNPRFYLDRHRIDQYLVEQQNALQGIASPQTTITTLKAIQRVFKVAPTYTIVDTLLSRNIDSAQQIYFMGREPFVRLLTNNNATSVLEAKRIYARAENAYTMTLALFGLYNQAVQGLVPYGAPAQTIDPQTQAKLAVLPDLQTLFGSLDYCECTDCRSVSSPAAYFVDIMHFISQRSTNGTGINAGKNVAQVLLERRPDLGEIELSCENTNTPLPYIDLVNEILEDVVAPPVPITLNSAIEPDLTAGTIKPAVLSELEAKNIPIAADALVYAPDVRGQWVIRDQQHAYKLFKTGATLQLLPTRQTFLAADELRANPAYTNQGAYDKLAQQVFPLNLPFDLWLIQARAYLQFLGVPQPRLLELFQQKLADNVTLAPSDLQIACAWLEISETEHQILTGTLAGKQSWDYWGLAQTGNVVPDPNNPADPTENVSGSWLDVLSNVDILLHRSGMSYTDLLQALDLSALNPTSSIVIFDTADSNAASCDTSKFTLQNLTGDALDRLHRFLRLQRKLGCTLWELDLLLPNASSNPNTIDKRITDQVLQDLSFMQRLREQFDLDWRVMYSLYHNIDHTIYFDRSTEEAPAIQTLYQRLFLNKLVDAVAVFPPSPEQLSGTIANNVPGLLAAFRIKETDLSLILADLALAPTDALNWTVLSQMYRITVLAKALALRVDDFLRLKRLWGQDPFATPAATWTFAQLAQKVATSSFSVLELDYLLAHRYTQNSGVALGDKTIVAFLQALREGLQKISDGLNLQNTDTPESYVKSKLGLLPTLVKDADQVKALGLIDGTWQGTTGARNSLIDTYFVNVLDLPTAHTNLAAIPSALSPAAYQNAVNQRFAYVQPALQAFLLVQQSEALIRQKTAEAFQLEALTASELLSGLHVPGATDPLLTTLNSPNLLSKQPDGTYTYLLDETSFPALFKALRLLHKNALLIGKLNIKANELAWWLDDSHASALGWMHPNDFPLDTTSAVPLLKWEHIQDFFAWKKTLPTSDQTAFEFLSLVLASSTSAADTISALALLTAWDAQDITDLVNAFRWDIKQEALNSDSLRRLADCMLALRRLGVQAARAIQFATAEPASADAESLKQTVKAKYDLAQWLQVIQPLQDGFREQKRQALVSWLVTHPDQSKGQNWSDANGLFSYFLIDVEMGACMLTSRLKQAASSVQLFVQRCLMNLEVDLLAKTDLDPKWKQWQWMKRYRLWEANRKIFLYPENWLEPELRDEKSPFFKDLENELTQNDINSDTVEQAYRNYLEKLDQVANLEIRAIFNESISPTEEILHVFARSRSNQAPHYFYRQRINNGRWLAWEKVELEISANHLLTGIHNRRLYLLWPQFTDKAEAVLTFNVPSPSESGYPVSEPSHYWEIRLFWSELKKGKWLPKVLSDSFGKVYQSSTGGNHPENLAFRVRLAPFIEARLFDSNSPASIAPTGQTQFNKIDKQVSYVSSPTTEHIISPPESQFSNNLLQHTTTNQYFYYTSVEESGKPHTVTAHENAESILLLRNVTPSFTYSVLDAQAHGFANTGTFFMWDSNRTYHVDYAWNKYYTYSSGAWHPHVVSAFQYFIHYHPFVELFIRELNIWGLKGLLNRQIQVDPASIPASPALFNFQDYQPTSNVVRNYKQPDGTLTYPVEDVDFTYAGAYSPYNWELFFHVPFYIANKLSTNQRFEDALAWFHTIFDPTNSDTTVLNPDTPQQKYWITKPFYETTKADYYKQKIENLLLAIAQGDTELRQQVEEWRDNPFNPHLIARMRTVAYQKNVLIKYIKTLIAWGDQLFSNDTIETINEATQLYILAASILGPRPRSIPRKVPNPVKTYYQLEQEGIDEFGNALKQVENLLPSVPASSSMDSGDSPELPYLNVLYFCIPHNEQLLTLWDTVADRLFKIRNCMNIEGVVRQLPLYEPPIDIALLVQAAAAGLDIGSVLSDLNAPLPLYRFTFMIQRALELCNEVRTLGSALLAALEKKDAEALAQLRSGHELIMLDALRLVKQQQIDEALAQWDALKESRHVVEQKQTYYQNLLNAGLLLEEQLALGLTGTAMVLELAATVSNLFSASISLVPDVDAGVSGFGGTPAAKLKFGGKNIANSAGKAAEVLKGLASIAQMGAGLSSTIGGYTRRSQEWDFQKSLADKELPQIDQQITAADIRHQIALQELANHDKQRENAQQEDDYLHTKFTNQDLYDWMINQLSTVYFQGYQLAYDIAKRAERCFRYELGLDSSSYIQFGYWDSLNKGLLCADKLFYDLKRLEMAYYEQNRRDYELTRHISLAQLDPVALLKLRQNGECLINVPETVFDMDYPGHYFRRIRTVSLSLPCIAGPYTSVACTLTLVSNHLRTDATLLNGKYERDLSGTDPRFRDEIAAIQSIATSSAQNDHGLFELNFRDERYLPFEGAGAISTWHIKLNKDFPQFDFSTISDLIIHLSYTAREGGELLRLAVVEEFNKKMNTLALAESRQGLFRVFDLKREYPDKWYRFLHPANPGDDQQLVLDHLPDRLPYFTRQFAQKKVHGIQIVARMKDTQTYQILLSPLGTAQSDWLTLQPGSTYQGLDEVSKDLSGNEVDLDTWTLKLKQDGAADFKSLPADAVEELFLIINYTIA
jgi:peptidoglycan hydrolase-like protein with peptidoglycan-binding domain